MYFFRRMTIFVKKAARDKFYFCSIFIFFTCGRSGHVPNYGMLEGPGKKQLFFQIYGSWCENFIDGDEGVKKFKKRFIFGRSGRIQSIWMMEGPGVFASNLKAQIWASFEKRFVWFVFVWKVGRNIFIWKVRAKYNYLILVTVDILI